MAGCTAMNKKIETDIFMWMNSSNSRVYLRPTGNIYQDPSKYPRCSCSSIYAAAFIRSYCVSNRTITSHSYWFVRHGEQWTFDLQRTDTIHGSAKTPKTPRRWLAIFFDANPDTLLFCWSCAGVKGTVGELIKDGQEWRGISR